MVNGGNCNNQHLIFYTPSSTEIIFIRPFLSCLMFISGEISVKKDIIVDKRFSEDYISREGKIAILNQFGKIHFSPLSYYPDLNRIQKEQCGSLSEKDLLIGRHNNIEKEEEDGNYLMDAMEIENSAEEEESLNTGDYSFRENPTMKWPNNRVPFELG